MKRSGTIITAAFMLAVLASCQAAGIPAGATVCPAGTASAPPAATEPVPASTIPYINLGFEVPYEMIEPVNPGEAKELRIAIPKEMASPQVIALPDDGALAFGQQVKDNQTEFTGTSKLMMTRYDDSGNMLWKKVYDALPDGYAGIIKVINEDEFVFTYIVPGDYKSEETPQNKQIIYFCGLDGNFYHQDPNISGIMYQFVVPTDSGVYAVGENTNQINQTADEEKLTILGPGSMSAVYFSRILVVDGYYSPNSVAWSKEAGLMVTAYKKEKAGFMDILSFDTETLMQKWKFSRDSQANLIYDNIVPTAGGVLADGFTGGKPFILKLDNNGGKLWEIAPDEGDCSVIAMAAYPDGRFIAAINRYKEDDPDRGVYLALFDETGAMLKRAKLPPNEIPTVLRPTDDGGLITVGTQNIKTLPQPAYVSSIWYDSETIVTKYGADLNIQWRKVYDKYKDSTRQDIAVPMANGGVIVEK